MPGLMSLPSRLLIVVATHTEKPAELAALALTCSRISRAVEVVLYRTLNLQTTDDVQMWDDHFNRHPSHMDHVVQVNILRGSYTISCDDRNDAFHIPRVSKVNIGDINAIFNLVCMIGSSGPSSQLRVMHLPDTEELITLYDVAMTFEHMLELVELSASRCGEALEKAVSRMTQLEDVKLERLSRHHQRSLPALRMETMFAGSRATLRTFSISGDVEVPGTRNTVRVLPALTTVNLQVSSVNARELFLMAPSLDHVTLGSTCRVSAKIISGQTIRLSFLQCSAMALIDLLGVRAAHISVTDMRELPPSLCIAFGASLLDAGPRRLDVHDCQSKRWKVPYNGSLASVRYLGLHMNGNDDALVRLA